MHIHQHVLYVCVTYLGEYRVKHKVVMQASAYMGASRTKKNISPLVLAFSVTLTHAI